MTDAPAESALERAEAQIKGHSWMPSTCQCVACNLARDVLDTKDEMRLLESRPKTRIMVTITRNLEERDIVEVFFFGPPHVMFNAIADEIVVNDIRKPLDKPTQLKASRAALAGEQGGAQT